MISPHVNYQILSLKKNVGDCSPYYLNEFKWGETRTVRARDREDRERE